jgi:hypothetical protein
MIRNPSDILLTLEEQQALERGEGCPEVVIDTFVLEVAKQARLARAIHLREQALRMSYDQALRLWRGWLPYVRSATSADLPRLQALYDSQLIQEGVLRNLLSADAGAREMAAEQLRLGGVIHPNGVIPPEGRVQDYLPPRGYIDVLELHRETGEPYPVGFFSMQVEADDVKQSLMELGWDPAATYQTVQDLPVRNHKGQAVHVVNHQALALQMYDAVQRPGEVAHLGIMVIEGSKQPKVHGPQGVAMLNAMLEKLHTAGVRFVVAETYAIQRVNDVPLRRIVQNAASEKLVDQTGIGRQIGRLEERVVCGETTVDIEWRIWVIPVAQVLEGAEA